LCKYKKSSREIRPSAYSFAIVFKSIFFAIIEYSGGKG
jgi:hypothetical protein